MTKNEYGDRVRMEVLVYKKTFSQQVSLQMNGSKKALQAQAVPVRWNEIIVIIVS